MDPRKRRQIIVFLLLVPLIFLCIIKLHYYLHPMRVSYIVSNDVSRHLKSVKDNIETATHSVFEDTDSKSGKTLWSSPPPPAPSAPPSLFLEYLQGVTTKTSHLRLHPVSF